MPSAPPRSMRALRYYGPLDIRLEEVAVASPGPGEALVRVEAALTCGTDLKMYRRGHPLARPPQIFGHEFVGRVVALGGGISHLREGMRVVASDSAPCEACYYCRAAQENLCERLQDMLIGFTVAGAYAEYLRLPARIAKCNTYPVPDHLPSTVAAAAEPLAAVVHGQGLASPHLGETVVIVGAGPIGLMHLQLARHHRAGRLLTTNRGSTKLELAKLLGADAVMAGDVRSQVSWVREATEGRGADLVIEAVGSVETWEAAVQMARPGGRVVLFGGCPGGTQVTWDTGKLHYGELQVTGAFHHTPKDFQQALDLLASKRVSVDPLLSTPKPLGEAVRAFEDMAAGRALKVPLLP